MPGLVQAAVMFVGSLFSGTSLGAFIVVNSAAIATVALVVATVAVGNYQRRKAMRAARDAYNAGLQDRLVMVPLVDGPRSRVYGRVRNVEGVLFKATRGEKSEYYTIIIALAGHEIDAVEEIYFGDTLVTLDVDGYVLTEPWYKAHRISATETMTLTGGAGSVTLPYTPIDGSVSVVVRVDEGAIGMRKLTPVTVNGTQVSVSGQLSSYTTATVNYQYSSGSMLSLMPDSAYARVRAYLGAPGQDLSADLVADFPALCTTADKFQGIACLRVDLLYSQDAFPTGVPHISAVIRGAKVYDTRDGVTRWTQNPALIARDWARYAYGGNTTAVDDAAITAAANVCDADTDFVMQGGTQSMDTYQCGIVARLDASPADVLSEIVESMAGRWGWAGGRLKIVAGSYRTPIALVTEDWCTDAGNIIITPSPPRSELVNCYRPTIANRDNKYQAEPAPPLIASTYVTADGQQLDAEITMAGVTSIAHAQHISGVLLRDARQSLVIQLPCNLRAFKLELFDLVTVTIERYGWSAKTFEVMGWRWSLQGGVILTLKEAAASVYTVDAGFADLGNDDNTDLPLPWTVESVFGLTISSGGQALTDGSIMTRTKVAWNQATTAAVLQGGRVEVQYMEVATGASSDWPGTMEGGAATQTIINGLRAGYIYLFKARFINGAGVRGPWTIQADHTISAVPATGGATTYAQASQPASGMIEGDLWYDSDDGNKPYRYSGSAWVAVQDGAIATAAQTALWDNVTGRPQSLTLINDANCTYSADAVTKSAGGAAWNAGMHSVESYIGGAFASIVVGASPGSQTWMFGLNDTSVTSSYTDINFAWYWTGSDLRVYEEGSAIVSGLGSVVQGDVLTVAFDGQTARYLKNGTTLHQHGVTNTLPLFFDCSINTQGTTISGIRFGPMSTPTNRNLIDSRTWVYGGSGTQPGFTANATSGGGSNSIVIAALPDGSRGSVWKATSGSAAGTSPEGGWDTTAFAIDHTKMYRFTVWIKASGGNGSGSFYHGVGQVNDIGGGTNANPYFNANVRSSINNLGWVLCVGYVYPSTYAGGQLNSGGVWRADTGEKIITGVDYRWVSGQATSTERAYQFYTTASGNVQEFWNPRVELCDGSERSIGAMLGDAAVAQAILAVANAATAQITADGKITTFVQASTPSALSIGDLWFDSDDGYKLYRAGAVGSGSWTPYQFGTSAIAAESATKVMVASGTGGTVSANETNILGGASSVQLCATSTYTNNTGADVTIQVEAHVDMQVTDSTPSGTGSRFAWFQINGGGIAITSPRDTTGAIPPYLIADSTPRSYTLIDQVTLANGASITPELRAYAHVTADTTPNSTITNSYSPSILRVTVIKR